MPLLPSEPFLLWQDAVRSRNWRKLLGKRLTKPRWIAIMMLQSLPSHKLAFAESGNSPQGVETHEDRVRRAIADGWGA